MVVVQGQEGPLARDACWRQHRVSHRMRYRDAQLSPSLSLVSYFVLFEPVVQADLELVAVLLPRLPKFWACWCERLSMTSSLLLIKLQIQS